VGIHHADNSLWSNPLKHILISFRSGIMHPLCVGVKPHLPGKYSLGPDPYMFVLPHSAWPSPWRDNINKILQFTGRQTYTWQSVCLWYWIIFWHSVNYSIFSSALRDLIIYRLQSMLNGSCCLFVHSLLCSMHCRRQSLKSTTPANVHLMIKHD